MASTNVASSSVPPQPKPEPILSQEDLESLARIRGYRRMGFLPDLAQIDFLLALVDRLTDRRSR